MPAPARAMLSNLLESQVDGVSFSDLLGAVHGRAISLMVVSSHVHLRAVTGTRQLPDQWSVSCCLFEV